jgi:4-amino-4-deoxy-L-arabinose transferase-like glycosyltransferase
MRSLYFPAITARPDMLCTAFGLAAMLVLTHWQHSGRRRLLVASGVLLGLGGLTHPFALAYALQAGGWVCLASRGWQRITRPVWLGTAALGAFALWLPLILAFPDAFRAQFFLNILNPAGPGLLSRLVGPWNSLAYHAQVMWEHLGPIQFLLLVGGTGVATVLDWRNRYPLTACALAWSSVYLLSAAVGDHHPTLGYWSYAAALMCVSLGRAISAAATRMTFTGWPGTALHWAAGTLLFAALLPGCGIRTWLAHVQHWNDINYNAPAFARQMLADLPADAHYTVDTQFALDFYVAGRRTLLAQTMAIYFSSEKYPYDYLVVSRYGLDTGIAGRMHGELVRTYGNRDDLFACYAEIYRPPQR